MMVTTEKNQNKLLSVIDKMFVFSINPETKIEGSSYQSENGRRKHCKKL